LIKFPILAQRKQTKIARKSEEFFAHNRDTVVKVFPTEQTDIVDQFSDIQPQRKKGKKEGKNIAKSD
jgi:hypothetical protein